ncbi:MAG: hypothetical protein O7D97_04230 [Planctomycetota bacterium]|nr:hypothetical protein [Planctomycetota bacterium]
MTSRSNKGIGAAVAGVVCVVAVAVVTGCGSDEAEPAAVVARNYTPPPPPPPKLTPVSELMAQLGIDERVRLPEDRAPDNDEARRAVLEFFDAFARGDDQVVASMVSTADRLELEALVDSGAWDETTNQITRIDVQTGSDPEDDEYTCALAIIYVDGSFQPQLWHYSVDDMDGARFDAAGTPPGIMDRLSGVDWIAAWFAVIAEEEALANKPDEDYRAPQKIYATGSSDGGVPEGPGAQPGGPSPFSPGGPGGPPGRRKPPPKRKPPGPP